MNHINKCFLLVVLFFIINTFFYSQDLTNDTKPNDPTTDSFLWLKGYLNIDVSDDLYYGKLARKYNITKNYIDILKHNQKINFLVDEVDKYNFVKNTNMLIWFPYIFMPYGGYSYRGNVSRGGDIYNGGFTLGFLYRMDNINNSNIAITFASSYAQRGKFFHLINLEHPSILKDNRLKLILTLSFFTTFPQYSSTIYYNDTTNTALNIFNKIWDRLEINFTEINETGLSFIGGVDYRIPKIELNSTSSLELTYKYDVAKAYWDGEAWSSSKPKEELLNRSNFSFNIKQEFRWNKLKQTSTIPKGNELLGFVKFYIPTSNGILNNDFRFKARIEEKFYKILPRDFAFKIRAIMQANYNLSEDFSGDPFIRGYVDKDITGFFALFTNLEFLIPLINVEIKDVGSLPTRKDAKILMYFNIFVDGGFTIENYDLILENSILYGERRKHNDFAAYNIDKNYYLIPALSAGAGIKLYPYFLNFIIRLDVAFNLTKIIYNKEVGLEIVFSFTDIF
ncbi:MAG: hypothetical protein A2Y34_04925 [Spirochaetes bacterium GWC1_27_15]|nr:MAG: hypothetical protein A2Y34_04925 [Spirochaetes bacterium GWC1_27_15]